MPISPGFLQSLAPRTAVDFGNEAVAADRARLQRDQAAQQLAAQPQLLRQEAELGALKLQGARDEAQSRRRAMAVSMLAGILQEPDPARQQDLIKTLVPMAQRYDPTLQFENPTPETIKALAYSQVKPEAILQMQQRQAGDLPPGWRFNPRTGTAEGIPGLDPSFLKKSDPFAVPVAVYDPATGQQTFVPRRDLASGNYQPPAAAPPRPKPPPPAVARLQQDRLDEIALANNTNADLGRFAGALAAGELRLGPWENLESRGRNWVGRSDATSRNFASFESSLEKLRNDSLRLNKGVQTEGDAERAWNELLANVNDPGVVEQRLAEIQAINARAADLKKANLDILRAEYNLDPLDYSALDRGAAVLPKAGGGRVVDFNDLPE
jgi:hypothetical protein